MIGTRIGEVAKQVLLDNDQTFFVWGDLTTIHEIHDRMGWKSARALYALNRVMNAMSKYCQRKDAIFEQKWGRWGTNGVTLCRGFWLKQ